jgi:hypothetical protein
MFPLLIAMGAGLLGSSTFQHWFDVNLKKVKQPDSLAIPDTSSNGIAQATDDWVKRTRGAMGPQAARVAIPSSLATRPNLLRPLLGTA